MDDYDCSTPEGRRAFIETLPRMKLVCGRDLERGWDAYSFGFLWGRNLEAVEGEWVYRHRFVIRLTFRLRVFWE